MKMAFIYLFIYLFIIFIPHIASMWERDGNYRNVKSLSKVPLPAIARRCAGKPGIGDIPLLFSINPKGSFKCLYHRQHRHYLAFDLPVRQHW